MQGYNTKQHLVPVKRYCRTMDLKPDDTLIREYIHRHSEGEAWPEILGGIREVGIHEMEIYIFDNRLFMIVETPVDFDWDNAMHASLPCHASRSGKTSWPSSSNAARVTPPKTNGK